MTVTTSTYDWIKRVPSALLLKDEAPLIGSSPSFPWEAFSSKLSEIFSIPEFSVKPTQIFEWRTVESILDGFGVNPQLFHITLVPSLPPVSLILAQQDIQLLMSIMLKLQPEALMGLDADFKNDFNNFLAIEVLNSLMHVDFDKTLDPHLLPKGELPHEPALCFDISIAVPGKTTYGRLVLSSEFRQGWKERYVSRSLDISKPMMQHLNVTVHLEAGRVSLTSSEWAQVNLGDFVLLDFCSLKSEGEGRVMLTVSGMPLFRGKIKDGNIKILEHPLYHEGETAMGVDKGDEDPALEEGEEAFEDEATEEGFEEDEEFDDAFDDQEFGEEQQATGVEEEHPQGSDVEAAESHEVTEPSAAAPEQGAAKKGFSPEDIPLSIVVEVGRLQMSLQKLMDLQPGNLLELNVRPENGVDLVVNGKCIAKGELLLLGDALGVRVLDIG